MAIDNTPRVFCIGMNKTGTSTMKHCFMRLGLGPIASPSNYDRDTRARIHSFYESKNYEDMLDLAAGYRSFEDRPWNMWSMYRHLDERFPGSRFILTLRDVDAWWRSTEQWLTVTKPEVLPLYQKQLRVTQTSREAMVESYLRYNAEVRQYFRGNGRLLEMNVEAGDGWDKLCAFLGVPVPAEEFPHANRQAYTEEDANLIRARRKLKHGVQCQACHETATVKVLRRARMDAAKPDSPRNPVTRALVEQIRPDRLEQYQFARRALYTVNSVRRLAEAPGGLLRRRRLGGLRDERELAVVSCFFNPGGSRARVRNFHRFLDGVRQSGVRCLVVELAFHGNAFQVEGHDDIIRLRSHDVMWHKERLLNIGIRQLLDAGYRKIAWLDGDIRFHDPDWPVVIARKLDEVKLCQVFSEVFIQTDSGDPPSIGVSGVRYFQETGRLYLQPARPRKLITRGLLRGGQSGYGWAATADVLRQVPLFDSAIVGGGDKLMMTASLANNLSETRFRQLTLSSFKCKSCGHRNLSPLYTDSFQDWAGRWSAAVGRSVGFAPLYISDMYHGKRSDRGYHTRHDILFRHGFDPHSDLTLCDAGCLKWASTKQALHRDVEAYFLSRREDG